MRECNWAKLDRNPKRKLSFKSNWIEGGTEDPHSPGQACFREMELKAIQEIVATPDRPNPKDPSQKTVRQERHTQGVEFGAKPSRSTEAAEKEARAPATEDSVKIP